MLTKNERQTIDKLKKELSETYQSYIGYVTPKGWASGGSDHKTMLKLRDAYLEAHTNLNNYLDAITEK